MISISLLGTARVAQPYLRSGTLSGACVVVVAVAAVVYLSCGLVGLAKRVTFAPNKWIHLTEKLANNS